MVIGHLATGPWKMNGAAHDHDCIFIISWYMILFHLSAQLKYREKIHLFSLPTLTNPDCHNSRPKDNCDRFFWCTACQDAPNLVTVTRLIDRKYSKAKAKVFVVNSAVPVSECTMLWLQYVDASVIFSLSVRFETRTTWAIKTELWRRFV